MEPALTSDSGPWYLRLGFHERENGLDAVRPTRGGCCCCRARGEPGIPAQRVNPQPWGSCAQAVGGLLAIFASVH